MSEPVIYRCPGCGAPLSFKAESTYTVCTYCRLYVQLNADSDKVTPSYPGAATTMAGKDAGMTGVAKKRIVLYGILLAAVLIAAGIFCISHLPPHTEATAAPESESTPQELVESTDNLLEVKPSITGFENDFILFNIDDPAQDSMLGYSLSGFVSNKTDSALSLTLENVCVNDYYLDNYQWECSGYVSNILSLESGAVAAYIIDFPEEDLKKNGIENVESIEFEVRIYDADLTAAEGSGQIYLYSDKLG